jgi:hypothetical protein
MDKMESMWQATVDQINAKIKEASEAMKQARELASNVGVKSLSYDEYANEYMSKEEKAERALLSKEESEALEGKLDFFHRWVNIYPLFNELDEAGWHTSSIGC